MLEAGGDQRLEIVGLEIGRDLALEALPGIAGAFDEFHRVTHVSDSKFARLPP
jgi:hypothetical protein